MIKTRRNAALDGLRGWACLCVVLSHVAAVTWVPFLDHRPGTWIETGLFSLGAPSVDVFLVLSGHVVAESIRRHWPGWKRFVGARYARLLPVAWIGVMLGLAVRQLASLAPAGAGGMFASLLHPLGLDDAVGLATLTWPLPNTESINGPLWTMIVEARAIWIMPILAFLAARHPLQCVVATTGIAIIAAIVTSSALPIFIVPFAVGAGLSSLLPLIPRQANPFGLLVLGISVMTLRTISTDSIMRIPCAIGAALIVIAVIRGTAPQLMQKPTGQFLGRLSYPLYAIHLPILSASVIAFGSIIGVNVAAACAIPVAIAGAWVVERLVDQRAIKFARLLRSWPLKTIKQI